MPRTIELTPTSVILHLNGLVSLAALRREVEIPYSAIRSISIEDFKLSMLQFRIGTSVSDIREGRFLLSDKWSFVSYENHKDVVVLQLTGHEFEKVIFQIDQPDQVKEQIAERLPQRNDL